MYLLIIHKGRENEFWFTREKVRGWNDFKDKLYQWKNRGRVAENILKCTWHKKFNKNSSSIKSCHRLECLSTEIVYLSLPALYEGLNICPA